MRRWGSRTAEVSEQAACGSAPVACADSNRFTQLFDQFWAPVLRYAFHELGSWEDAEDVAQQTMIEVARALHRFVPERGGSQRSWVFAIAHARVIDTRRRSTRRPTVPLPDDPPWMTNDVLLDDAADRDWLQALLSALPPNEREVLVLRAAELTTDEIAVILNISEAAVRQRTKRARDRLRPMLSAPEGRRHG
jgi:RNA polymerase sigma-70 factor (ECF subfamily)